MGRKFNVLDELLGYLLYPLAALHYWIASRKPNVFIRMLNKEIDVDLVYEDDDVIVIKDKFPLANVHLLVIPREKIHSWKSLKPEHTELIRHMDKIGKRMMVEKHGCSEENCMFGFMTPPYNSQMQLHMHCINLPLKEDGGTIDFIRTHMIGKTSKFVTPKQVLRKLNKKIKKDE